MTFSRPEVLAAIPFVLLLLVLAVLAQRRRLKRVAEAYGDGAIGRLLPLDAQRFPRARLACLAGAGLAICLAAAGPGETRNQDPQAAVPLDIAVVVDASISMGASDVAPTRIQHARDVVVRLAKAAPKGRLALVVFGDWPYTLTPPTDDPEVAAYFARSLTGTLVSNLASSIRTATGDRGASLQAAIAHARSALGAPPGGKARRVVLVISDGALPGDAEEARAAAAAASKAGVAVWTAGIGTAGGTRLELAGRPVFDGGGSPVIADFDEALLRSVARAGGGVYQNVSDEAGARALVSGLRGLSGVAGPQDVGPERAVFWLLLIAIALLLLEGGLDAGRRLAVGRLTRRAG